MTSRQIAAPYFGMVDKVENIEAKVAAVVAVHAGTRRAEVGPSTRLWHDLKLAGDDFADLVEELHRTYGITLPGRLGDYCPTEVDLWWAFWWWPFRRRKQSRELTISELAAYSHTHVH